MKFTLVICTFVLSAVALTTAQLYTNKFDSVDLDEILNNQRILQNYNKCLLDKGPCTPEGRELKKLLPEAIQTDCEKCSPLQKKNSEKVIKHLRTHNKDEWKILAAKYDPKGLYRARHHLDY